MNISARHRILSPLPGLLPSVDAGLDGGGGPGTPQTSADSNGVWGAGVTPPTVPGIQQIQQPIDANVALLRDPTTGKFTKEATDILEQARAEERAKLHRANDDLTNRIKVMEDERAERLAREAALQKAADEEAERARLAELTAVQRVEEVQANTNQRIAELQDQIAQRDALQAQEERYQQVQNYRSQRLAQESALIAPPLVELVTGNTEDEIERSIALVKAKTEDMVNLLAENNQQYRQQQRGVAPTGQPPVGPMDSASGQQTITAETIDAMDPATYAANRSALMAAARASGPYGR